MTIESQTAHRNVYDGSNMVLSFDGSGNLTDRYLWGPAVDQVLADEQFDLTGADELPSSIGNTLWSLDNNQNSVTDVINNAGEIQEHIAYSPFGAQTGLTTGSVTFAFGYTGAYTDATTKFQYHSEADTGIAGRWYDPASQRWISQDLSGLTAGPDPYEYVGDSPVDDTDPSGLGHGFPGHFPVSNEYAQQKLLALAKDWATDGDKFAAYLLNEFASGKGQGAGQSSVGQMVQ